MPIKTNYLGLDKLQTNEYYSSDIENANLDKIDDKLKNHEERTVAIENKVHNKDQLLSSLSPTNKVASVTNSFSGICDFEIKGTLVEQLIRNGDFKNGGVGWCTQASTKFSLENKIASITAGNEYNTSNLTTWSNGSRMNTKAGDKFYMYCKARVTNDQSESLYPVMHNGKTLLSDYSANSIDNPEKDKWYDIHGIFTADDNGTALGIYSVQKYIDPATANGKVMQVDGNTGAFCIKLTQDDMGLSKEQLKLKYVDRGYFEGIQPLRGISVETIGRNLFDINKRHTVPAISLIETGNWSGYEAIEYSLKPNTNYTIHGGINNSISATYVAYPSGWYKVLFNNNSSEMVHTFNITTDDTGKVLFCIANGNVETILDSMYDMMLTEGVSPPQVYIPHISSELNFSEDALAGLANGISDKIVRENGKTIKIVNTNLGRDGKLYEIKKEDISFVDNGTNMTYARMKAERILSGLLPITNQNLLGTVTVEGLNEVGLSGWDNTQNIGTFNRVYANDENNIDFYFPLGTTLDEAKDLLVGKKIVYQLDKPQVIDIDDKVESLNSYQDYSCYQISDGTIKGEKVKVTSWDANSRYYANIIGFSLIEDSPFKYRAKKILDVYYYDGGIKRSVINNGSIFKDNAYGNELWSLSYAEKKANNIDINKLYVDYITEETSGSPSIVIKYNADLSTAVSSISNAVNTIGEQTDMNTEIVDLLRYKVSYQPTLLHEWIVYDTDKEVSITANNLVTQLHGIIKLGKADLPIFTIPEDYMRPLRDITIPVKSHGTTNGSVKVKRNGDVVHIAGSNSYIDLSSIVFMNKGI